MRKADNDNELQLLSKKEYGDGEEEWREEEEKVR